MSATPGHPERVEDVDVFAPATIENWYPTYDLLQREAPAYHVPGTSSYFLTRYEDVYRVLRETETFRRGSGLARPLLKDEAARNLYAEKGWPKLLPLAVDPPLHRRFRDLVDHFFSVGGAETRRELITEVVNELIDGFFAAAPDADGRFHAEYVSAFAKPLPVRVITRLIGFPAEDIPRLTAWSAAWVAPFSGQLDAEQERVAAEQMVEFQHYIHAKIAEKRDAPGDDVLSYLVHNEVKLPDGPRPLTDGEIINMIDHLYIGGNETTTFALTSGMWLLIQRPDLQARLRAQPNKVRAFVDEVLRLESPTQGMDRHTAVDTEIAGCPIPKGSHIHIRYAAANRDERQFEHPEEILLDRANGHRHLAFSIGESHCPGAGLSRLEQTIATEALLGRLDGLAFDEGMNDFTHHTNLTLRAFKALHISFTAAP